MWQAILGGAATAVGGIFGGIGASKARQRAKRVLDERERRADAVHNRDYYKDYTETASAQGALAKAREIAGNLVQGAEGRQAVMGGTDASVADAKAKANDAIGDATASIAANGEQKAAAAETQYQSQMDAIDKERAAYETQTANNIAKAGTGVMEAGMNLASGDMDMFGLGKHRK